MSGQEGPAGRRDGAANGDGDAAAAASASAAPPAAPLGFSLAGVKSKAARAKVAVQVQERPEERVMITGIEGARIKTAAPELQPSGPRVIPAVANTYRAGVGRGLGGGGGGGGGFVPSFVPPSSEDALKATNEEKFVAAPKEDGTQAVVRQYGLQRMGAAAAAAATAQAAAPKQEHEEQPGIQVKQEEQQQQQQQQQQPDVQVKQEDHRDALAGPGTAADAIQQQIAARAAAAGSRGGGGGAQDAKAALMEELGALPDAADADAYEETPVEDFAKALLRGMGWRDGEGVGRARASVEVKQIVPRPERLGLGADPAAAAAASAKRGGGVVKMGDKPREDLVAAPTAGGRARHRVGLDEKLVPRESTLPGPRPGKEMAVVGGRHAGMACVVVRSMVAAGAGAAEEGRDGGRGGGGGGRAIVRLLPSHEEVEVLCSELGELGTGGRGDRGAGGGGGSGGSGGGDRRPGSSGRGVSREPRGAEADRRRERESGGGGGRGRDDERRRAGGHDDDRGRGHSSKRPRSRSRSRDRDRHRDHRDRRRRSRSSSSESSSEEEEEDDHRRHHQQQQQQQRSRRPTWLFPLIRVRILDKRLNGGRLYLRKGVVVDVHPGALADVAVDADGGGGGGGQRGGGGGGQRGSSSAATVVQVGEDLLETVVPKRAGSAVQVVAGPYRGRRGRLLQASTASGQGAAAVQLAGDMEVVRLRLDDVAEFTGGDVDDEEL